MRTGEGHSDGKRKEEEREKVVGACVIAYGVFQPPDVVLLTSHEHMSDG